MQHFKLYLSHSRMPVYSTHIFANGCVAKPRNSPTITAFFRLALNKNLRTLNRAFLSARDIALTGCTLRTNANLSIRISS